MTRFETDPPSRLDRAEFVARFGGIYEHSPWIAETVRDRGRIPDDAEALAETMAAVVEEAGEAAQLTLLRVHPDLAGKLAVAGALSPESTADQAGADLDRCTPEEFVEFRRLNEAYKARSAFRSSSPSGTMTGQESSSSSVAGCGTTPRANSARHSIRFTGSPCIDS